MSQKPCLLSQSVLHPYTGGHTAIYGGYVFELCPDHPKANPWGFVPQHRLIVERNLGRYLTKDEQVHHDDEVKTNNNLDNLFLMTRSEHMRLHRLRKRGMKKLAPLSEESVREALRQQGTLKKAAASLGVHTQTIRNRFPDLVEPYKRKAPTKIDAAETIDLIRTLAADKSVGYREIAERAGVAYMTVKRICLKNGIPWGRKSRKGEVHRTYRRKTPIQTSLAVGA